MKNLQNITLLFFLIITTALSSPSLIAQRIEIDSAQRITMPGSDELFPAWSSDNRQIAFQSNQNGNNNLFIYDLKQDTIRQITSGKADKQHPVFIPNSNDIAFDSQINDKVYIFKIDPATGQQDVVFKRKLFCKEPSFSPSGRMIVFTGYDKTSESWQIFSYDFIYDNLNQLTHYKQKKVFNPLFSPNGKIILFKTEERLTPFSQSLEEINWYGKSLISIDTISAQSYCWSPDSYRIVCTLKKDSTHRVISIRKDGSAAFLLSDNEYQKATPALSPDGKKLALAVKLGNDFDIIIVNLDD